MANDFSLFWQNNEQTSALFYDLIARAEKEAYDDDFLAQLAAYREATPNSERADIFAARYLLAQDDVESACLCAERAYQKRPVNYEVWKLLGAVYARLGRTTDVLTMYGYAHGLYLTPDIPPELFLRSGTEGLNRLSVATGLGTGSAVTDACRTE